MRRMAIVIVLGSLVTPLLAQQESQLLIPLTTPDGKRAPNVGVGDLTISEDGKPVKILKIEPSDTPIRVTLSLDNGRGLCEFHNHVREIPGWSVEVQDGSIVTTTPTGHSYASDIVRLPTNAA